MIAPSTIGRVPSTHPIVRDFVRDSWLRSYRRAPDVRSTPWDIYLDGMGARIDRIVASQQTMLVVALAENVVLGWACWDPRAVHYAYVKRAYRRSGLAWRLVEGAPMVFTHRVPGAWNDALKKAGWQFNPWGKQ
jgi:hypothetical protein